MNFLLLPMAPLAQHSACNLSTILPFASDDVFAAAQAASENGIAMLEVPRNYYDDLETRFGLDPALVDRMATLNSLYDRGTEGGVETEYFQFYTPAFATRVFFEVVERRGYDAYGAANATIRLAAQALFKPEVAAYLDYASMGKNSFSGFSISAIACASTISPASTSFRPWL
jgi:hypothetical protein